VLEWYEGAVEEREPLAVAYAFGPNTGRCDPARVGSPCCAIPACRGIGFIEDGVRTALDIETAPAPDN
jgi:hypothetical protein